MAVLQLLLLVVGAACGAAHRPNIILLMADEFDGRLLDPRTSGTSLPYYDVAPMPHLKKMLLKSVSLVNAYSNNPLCAPSRASMWSGRYASTSRAYSNVKPLLCDVTNPSVAVEGCEFMRGYRGACRELARAQRCPANGTLNLVLQSAGYDVKLFGKMDTGGGRIMNPYGTTGSGFHTALDWPVAPRYSADSCKLYCPGDTLHSWASGANITRAIRQPLADPSSVWVNASTAKGSPWERADWATVENCVHTLTSWKRGDEPFFLLCSLLNPHPPYWSNNNYEAGLNKAAMQKLVHATRWQPTDRMHPADRVQQLRAGVPEEWNETLAWEMSKAYYGQIQETDAMLGNILRALDASPDARDSTVTVFTADHGELRLEHRLVEKMSHFEGSARVPLMVMSPHFSPRQVEWPVSLIDLFPTFLDLASVERPPYLEGQSLRAALNGHSPLRDYVISEFMGESTAPNWMVRQGRWKLITYGSAYAPKLFDLHTDPAEKADLSGHLPGVVSTLDSLLASRINVTQVLSEIVEEGKANVRRWMASFGSEKGWLQQFLYFYKGTTLEDAQKLKEWLQSAAGSGPEDATLEDAQQLKELWMV